MKLKAITNLLKKLKAIYLEKDIKWLKAYISELLLEKFSTKVAGVFENLETSVPDKDFDELFLGDCPWVASFKPINSWPSKVNTQLGFIAMVFAPIILMFWLTA